MRLALAYFSFSHLACKSWYDILQEAIMDISLRDYMILVHTLQTLWIRNGR
jgi:hypothetical protein